MQLRLISGIAILLLIISLPLHSEMKIDLEKLEISRIMDFQFSLTDSINNRFLESFELVPSHFEHKLRQNVIWVQKSLNLSGKIREFDHLILYFFNFSPAFDVYWDGKHLGSSGRINSKGEVDRTGEIICMINIQNKMGKEGKHTLAIRLFCNQNSLGKTSGVLLGYRNSIEKWKQNKQMDMRYYFGFFLVLAFISFSLYFAGNRTLSYLFFGIYTGFYSMTNLLSYLMVNNEVSLSLYRIILPIINNGDEIFGAILVLFLLWHFNLEKKKYYLIILSMILISVISVKYVFFQDITIFPFFFILPFHLISIYICYKSYLRKIDGSLTALISFVVFTIPGIINYIFNGYPGFFSSNIQHLLISWFYLTLLLSVIINIQSKSKKSRELMIRSKRLETELLKKSIHPHFILNTLLSLKSLIASGGNKAEKLIDSLAEEFNLIREISSRDKIAVKTEIELCRLHLRIMGYRRYAEYKLNTDCKHTDALIPPLILHTLVENGITHSFRPKENGVFELSCFESDLKLNICLTNNGSLLERKGLQKEKSIEEGTGIKYIRSRLNETYEKNWNMEYGVFEKTWMVKIIIPFEE